MLREIEAKKFPVLTQRVALANDLWFHAAHVPGSHVILRSPDGKPATAPGELVEAR